MEVLWWLWRLKMKFDGGWRLLWWLKMKMEVVRVC
jgi:hypothetical protein